MVNFTCNTCGDSLKKNAVAVHYSRNAKCRNSASLTCIDCLKVFSQDYTGHTFCVSEDQRYGANGLGGIQKNKQQIRNEEVCRHLQSVLTSRGSTLSGGVKAVINYVLTTAVVPRKEKAFLNSVMNCSRFSESDAKTVWTIVSEVKNDESNQPNGKPSKDDATSGDVKSNGVKELNAEAGKQKKKNKSQPSEAVEEMDKSNSSETTNNGVADKTKKKKKKSKTSNDENPEKTLNTSEASHDNSVEPDDSEEKTGDEPKDGGAAMDVEDQNGGSVAVVESKKEKKLKKKREKYEAEMRALENATAHVEVEENMDNELETQQEGKKKKSKKLAAAQNGNDEAVSKGKKKRQRTESMVADTDQPKKKNKGKENVENAEPVEEENGTELPEKQKDFKWADVIIKVLQSQNDNEMSVKRLCKKVVNEYLCSLLEGAHIDEVKATAKFQKKLHKTPGVFVHKDKAKLKSSD